MAETVVLQQGFLDIATIEVLRGPQGTFVGQSSTGGAIRINAARPNFDGINGYFDAALDSQHGSEILRRDQSAADRQDLHALRLQQRNARQLLPQHRLPGRPHVVQGAAAARQARRFEPACQHSVGAERQIQRARPHRVEYLGYRRAGALPAEPRHVYEPERPHGARSGAVCVRGAGHQRPVCARVELPQHPKP